MVTIPLRAHVVLHLLKLLANLASVVDGLAGLASLGFVQLGLHMAVTEVILKVMFVVHERHS